MRTRSELQALFAAGEPLTGANFEEFLNSFTHKWDDQFAFAGEAQPGDTPITSEKVFYIAKTGGSYTNFQHWDGAQLVPITVATGETCILWNDNFDTEVGFGYWNKIVIHEAGSYSNVYTHTFETGDINPNGTIDITYAGGLEITRPLMAVVTPDGSLQATEPLPVTKVNATSCRVNLGAVMVDGTIDIIYIQ